jgi:tRNA pseudouridine32 synthase/23S rRNA pseudouridine746 synthase
MLTALDELASAGASPFPSPFDELGPSTLARHAAAVVLAELRSGVVAADLRTDVLDEPAGGKMFGVLVVEDGAGRRGFLRAFSGTLGGRFDVPGYAPPIFDRDARAAVEVPGEAVVKDLLARRAAFASSEEVVALRQAERAMTTRHGSATDTMRARHRDRRAERRRRTAALATAPDAARNETAERRAQQSRRDKAERRALHAAHAAERRTIDVRIRKVDRRLAAFERLRRLVCRRLMQRIHDTYRVPNARGATRALRTLFAPAEPPTGAGDCVAPKLLAAAYASNLRPLALAEFWWGAPPAGGGRVAGAFYPACRDKCGPLLPFMLEGVDVAPPRRFAPPSSETLPLRVVFEDDRIVVVDKPCGLLSVDARDRRSSDSVAARLRRTHPGALLVHRLDLDTSGLLVAARDGEAYASLQRQFLARTVEKRYAAIVEGQVDGGGGVIDLPLRVDVDDRPRQIHDPVHGRSAVTEWRRVGTVASTAVDGAIAGTRVAFFPRTGRTHQLRVHAAHPGGLGAPIAGDRLYGHAGERLMLHAEALTFAHPTTGERVTFTSPAPF